MTSLNPSYLEDLQNHLEHSAVIAYSITNKDQVSFSIARSESTGWIEGKLLINNISNVYFQRFATGMEREGIRNVARLKINAANNSVAWIDKIQEWTNVFTGEKGVELQFIDGIQLRFTGDLVLSMADEHLNEKLDYTMPSKKHESRVKFIKGVVKAPVEQQTTVSEVSTIEEALNDNNIHQTLQENELSAEYHMEMQENQELSTPDLHKVENQVDGISEPLPADSVQTSSLIEQSDEDEGSATLEEAVSDTPPLFDEKSSTTISIRRIKGVTKTNRQMLIDNGFDTIAKIAAGKVPELVKIKGIGKPTAKKLIDNARLLLQEVQ